MLLLHSFDIVPIMNNENVERGNCHSDRAKHERRRIFEENHIKQRDSSLCLE
jgi:hypothetical protein